MVAARLGDVGTNHLFKVKVATFTLKPVVLQQGERIGSSLPVPVPAEPFEVGELEGGNPDHEGYFTLTTCQSRIKTFGYHQRNYFRR